MMFTRMLRSVSAKGTRGFTTQLLRPRTAPYSRLPASFGFSNVNMQSKGFASSANPNAELLDALSAELASEESDFEEDPEYMEISEQIKQSFTIEDTEGLGVTKLHSKFSGGKGGEESIEITFDCQDEAEMDMDMDSLASLADNFDSEDDADEGDVMDYGINFQVKIAKSDGSKLVVDCIAAKEMQIEGVQFVAPAFSSTVEQEEQVYGGPVFDQLDETLQDAFYEYLADRKIDNDMAFFVLAFSRSKEQREYVNWINNVLAFAQ